MRFQCLHDLCDSGALLADRDVDTNYIATLLINDGVDRDRGLTGLAITNDQFALSAADRNHRVDCLETSLQRLFHALTVDNARSQTLDRIELIGDDRTFTVDG